jgi:tRNA nucleotidyltransferase/poly(A) polymerase
MIKRKPRNSYEKKLFAVLDDIDEISKRHGFVVFVVGGFVRDEVTKNIHEPGKDVDLMAENYRGLDLAGLVAEHFNVEIEYHHRTGTAKMNIDGIDLDFQANIKIYEFVPAIRKTGLPQNNFTFNMLSRDFTINSMAISLRSWTLYDITGNGVSDIKNKILRTPIDPVLVLQNNPIVALRAIRFAATYGFEIDDELKNVIIEHGDFVNKIDQSKKEEILGESLEANKKRTIELLSELKINSQRIYKSF